MLENFSFVIVGNGKRKIDECLNRIVKFLDKKVNYQVIRHFPFTRKDKSLISKSDLVIVLGGDGTTLEVTRCINDLQKTKIIPVNFGTLGYMTSVDEKELIGIIKNYHHYLKSTGRKSSQPISDDDQIRYGFKVDERCLLSVSYLNKKYLCLNEIFLTHKDPAKSILINIEINGESLAQFKGDGVLLSTPTGSTAYNMSSGGPILTPHVDAMVLNALSAHALNLKPVVLSKNERVKFYTPDHGVIVVDGMKVSDVKEPIHCYISDKKLTFIKSLGESHIKVLKSKLRFGGSLN